MNKITAEITESDIRTLRELILHDPCLISSVAICTDQREVKLKKIGPHGTKRLEVQVAIIPQRQSDVWDQGGRPGTVTAQGKVPVGNAFLNGLRRGD